MRHRLVIAARAILAGWIALFVSVFLMEGLLLGWIGPVVGAHWVATAHLTLDCAALAGTGWAVGRFNRSDAIFAASIFAVSLCFRDFGDAVAIDVPWLLRLAMNAARDSRFVGSFLSAAATHVFLFGSLFAGAMLSRRADDKLQPLFSKE
jgi:hypothetical protein